MNVDQKTYDRFMAKVSKDPCGCWIWNGAIGAGGYGEIGINKKKWRAHRLSYEIHKGPIPEKLLVCHSCDNPPCVNPDHLWLGTQKDNMVDMISKKRKKGQKLTKEDVCRIRESPWHSEYFLAAEYGVSRSHIYAIKYRKSKSWNDI